MKVNLSLGENNLIKGFKIFPFDPSLPTVDVASPYEEISIGVDSFVDGKIVKGEKSDSGEAFGEILSLKKKLADTDYQAIKNLEGELSDDDYASVKEQRREWRAKINELEAKL